MNIKVKQEYVLYVTYVWSYSYDGQRSQMMMANALCIAVQRHHSHSLVSYYMIFISPNNGSKQLKTTERKLGPS